MATNESSSRRGGALDTITNLFAIGLVIVVGWLAWPSLMAQLQARGTVSAPIALPTAAVVSHPQSGGVPQAPAVNVQQSIDAYNASQQATAAALVAPAAPLPNVDATGDSAPLVHESKAAPDRAPAGAAVPTAEPIQQAESNDQFGSKPAKPINIQETHQCLHAQVWTDRGCKNPTPVQ